MSLQLITLEKKHAKLIHQMILSNVVDFEDCHVPTLEYIYWMFKILNDGTSGFVLGLASSDKLVGVFGCHMFFDEMWKKSWTPQTQTFVNCSLYFLCRVFRGKKIETFFKDKIYDMCKLGSTLISKYPCLDPQRIIQHTSMKTFVVPINMKKLLELNVISELPAKMDDKTVKNNPLVELTKNSDLESIKPTKNEPFSHTLFRSVGNVMYSYIVPPSDLQASYLGVEPRCCEFQYHSAEKQNNVEHLVFSVCDFVDKSVGVTSIVKTAVLERFFSSNTDCTQLFKFGCDRLLSRGIDQVVIPENIAKDLDVTKYEYIYLSEKYMFNLT
jgi:hypothetical protein